MNKSLNYGIITIILFNVIFLTLKPQLFFTKHVPKQFGARRGETILPYHSVSLLLGIMVYSFSLFNA
jgi:hypothetical protein